MQKKLICFHLLNDYSGSPKVLKTVLQGLLDEGFSINLITSRGGVLDELNGHANLAYKYYDYHFSAKAIVALWLFIKTQIYTFCYAFRFLLRKNTMFYINTLLPVGPALAGRIMGKRVIYHYHENAGTKGAFYRLLCRCMQFLATEIICVSPYQRSLLKRQRKVWVVPNALPDAFVKRLTPDCDKAFMRKRVLMLGSLKHYKGTREFIILAQNIPQYEFVLVVNDTENNIEEFINCQKITIPANLRLFPCQNDVIPFYNTASLVLNLSDKNFAIETFGLTALEAMSAGLPVIVPTVGGIAELVEDGYNGYKIDVADLDKIAEHIRMMLSDKSLYENLSANALAYSRKFSSREMINAIVTHLNQ